MYEHNCRQAAQMPSMFDAPFASCPRVLVVTLLLEHLYSTAGIVNITRRQRRETRRTPFRPSKLTENASRCVLRSNGVIAIRCFGGTCIMVIK